MQTTVPHTIVRRATTDDVSSLARLRLDFRGPRAPNVESEHAFLTRCARWMEPRVADDSAWRAWVLEHDRRIVGAIWVQIVEKIPNPTAEPEAHAYVSNLYVVPDYRIRAGERPCCERRSTSALGCRWIRCFCGPRRAVVRSTPGTASS